MSSSMHAKDKPHGESKQSQHQRHIQMQFLCREQKVQQSQEPLRARASNIKRQPSSREDTTSHKPFFRDCRQLQSRLNWIFHWIVIDSVDADKKGSLFHRWQRENREEKFHIICSSYDMYTIQIWSLTCITPSQPIKSQLTSPNNRMGSVAMATSWWKYIWAWRHGRLLPRELSPTGDQSWTGLNYVCSPQQRFHHTWDARNG